MSTIGGSTPSIELASLKPLRNRVAIISAIDRAKRLNKAWALMSKERVSALLIGAGSSLRYFAGVPWGASERLVAMLLLADREPIFICPKFEEGSFTAELAIQGDLALWEEDESPSELLAKLLPIGNAGNAHKLGVDPAMSYLFANRIAQAIAKNGWQICDASPIVDGCRMYKSDAELALMQDAKSITLQVHRHAAKILREGISQREVRDFINDAHLAINGAGSSFCIVQFGQSTAYPHGLPGERYLKEGDVVLIDTGTTIDGYNSDITRTYVYGQPSADVRRIWAVEQEAQQAAFDAVKPDVACETVDAAARQVLARAGLGPDYRLPGLPHRTGHGIGLSIHEPAYLVRGDKTPLAPGMCFSNEPMIVIPNQFGIRLEDHFYVTQSGAKWFTQPQPSLEQPFAD
jgi:Xaa-Pro dipeptidase